MRAVAVAATSSVFSVTAPVRTVSGTVRSPVRVGSRRSRLLQRAVEKIGHGQQVRTAPESVIHFSEVRTHTDPRPGVERAAAWERRLGIRRISRSRFAR